MKPQTRNMGIRKSELDRRENPLNTPLEGQHPQILANSDASDVFTFLASVSSGLNGHVSKSKKASKLTPTDDVPEDIHARHDADKENLEIESET